MIRSSLISLLVLLCSSARAQEQFGIAHSNYAGTDAISLNPARMANQWQWMDINVIGADAFIQNNHVYVTGKNHSMLGELRESIRSSKSDDIMFSESLDPGGRYAFVSQRIKGPAVAVSLGRGSLGAAVSTRLYTSGTGIGSDLARFMYNGLNFPAQHGIRYDDAGVRIVSAAWTEFGLTYARILKAEGYQLISVGATAKYLLAHHGAGIQFDALDYTVVDSVRADIHNTTGSYGIATPDFAAGSGSGFDVGLTYERTMDEADGYIPHQSGGGCDPIKYRYRFGLSILDLGGMHFANAEAGQFTESSATFPDYPSIDISGGASVDSLLQHSLSTVTTAHEFGIGLPTAIAVQYDQRIIDHVYVAADVIQNISPVSSLRLRRTNTFAVVPRFEIKRFEAALPVVWHEYEILRPSVGLMLRMNSIIVGSDNLLAIITRAPVYGADIYFRIKWTIFRSPICKGKKKAAHHSGDSNALPCTVPE